MEKNYSEQESLNQFIAFLQDHFKHVNEEKGYIDLGPNGNEALKRAVYEFFCRYINKVKNHDYCFKLEGVCRKNNQPCILEEKSTGHISHECCWIIENDIQIEDYLNLQCSEIFSVVGDVNGCDKDIITVNLKKLFQAVPFSFYLRPECTNKKNMICGASFGFLLTRLMNKTRYKERRKAIFMTTSLIGYGALSLLKAKIRQKKQQRGRVSANKTCLYEV